RFEDGIIRHNLGLEEAMFSLAVACLFAFLGRRPRPPALFLTLLIVLYAPFRFILDFLRIRDVRYAALTPAQWASLGLLAFGIWLLKRHREARWALGSRC